MLQEGLTRVLPPEKISDMTFKVHYLAVQNNMTHYGTWTAETAIHAVTDKECTPESLKKTLTAADEVTLVNKHIMVAGSDLEKCLSSKLNLTQIFLRYLGFGSYSKASTEELSLITTPGFTSSEGEDGWITIEREPASSHAKMMDSLGVFVSSPVAPLAEKILREKESVRTTPTSVVELDEHLHFGLAPSL